MAAAGLAIALLGFGFLALAGPAVATIETVMLALGLVGAGGNSMYVAAFTWVNVFDRPALPCSILSGGTADEGWGKGKGYSPCSTVSTNSN